MNDEALLQELFCENIPLIDVRAPIEFESGAFPGAINIPLLDNEQRHQIGICYKQQGQEKAIELGLKLVSGDVKQQRLDAWSDFIVNNPNAHLFCFRGGLRSRTSQQWLAEQGINIPIITGGYKRMRRFLLNTLEEFATNEELIILAGKTGVAKTQFIQQHTLRQNNAIDLEGLAIHRGSSFGQYVHPQPSQINFENALAIDYLQKKQSMQPGFYLLEDEGKLIGKMLIPLHLFEKMQQAKVIELTSDLESRITVILNDYIISNYQDYQQLDPNNAPLLFQQYLLASLDRIKKRLGGKNYAEIRELMQHALTLQFKDNDLTLHKLWIKKLLLDYYDPMYEYQLAKKQARIVFRGDLYAVNDWLSAYQVS